MVLSIDEAFQKLKEKELQELAAHLAKPASTRLEKQDVSSQGTHTAGNPNQLSSVISVSLSNTNNWHPETHDASTSSSTLPSLNALVPFETSRVIGLPTPHQEDSKLSSSSPAPVTSRPRQIEKWSDTLQTTATPQLNSPFPRVSSPHISTVTAAPSLLVVATFTLGFFLICTVVIIIFGSIKYARFKKLHGLFVAPRRPNSFVINEMAPYSHTVNSQRQKPTTSGQGVSMIHEGRDRSSSLHLKRSTSLQPRVSSFIASLDQKKQFLNNFSLLQERILLFRFQGSNWIRAFQTISAQAINIQTSSSRRPLDFSFNYTS